MTDTTLLNDIIKDKGIKKIWLADKIGVSRQRLYNILDGADVSVSEIEGITEALGINATTRNKIFFASKVE